jgi:hypothetical protein
LKSKLTDFEESPGWTGVIAGDCDWGRRGVSCASLISEENDFAEIAVVVAFGILVLERHF